MSESADPPHVDMQRLSDTGAYVYEAVATLEYTGRAPSREAIAAAADLDDEALDKALADLTRQGVLTTTGDSYPVYVPARRDWSTQPGKAAGHPLD